MVAVLDNGEWVSHELSGKLLEDKQPARNSETPKTYALRSAVAGKDGSVWMMQEFNGRQRLLRFKDGTFSLGANGDPDSLAFTSIRSDYRGNILYTTEKKTGLLDPAAGTFRMLFDQSLKAFAADASAIWYAVNLKTMKGINEGPTTLLRRLDLQSGKTHDYTTENCPVDFPIDQIRADAAGNLAILSNSEVVILDKTDLSKYKGNWRYYSSGYMDAEDYTPIDWIAENNTGAYPVSVSWLLQDPILRYVGIYRDGAWEYRNMAVDTEAPLMLGMKATRPTQICYTPKGIVVGTANNGPMLFDPEKQYAANIQGYDKKTYGEKVNAIAADKSGTIWIGTGDGLVRYDGTAFTFFNAKNSDFKGKKVNCLYVAPDNTLWVGTAGEGIFVFDGAAWKNYAKKEVFKYGNIGGLAGSGGTVYATEYSAMGQSKLLYICENGTFRTEEIPYNTYLDALIAEPGGTLWIVATRSGVCCRRADGTQVTYDTSNSPVGYKGSIPTAYSMQGFWCDGRLYLKTSYEQMTDPMGYYATNETMKELCKKYKDRVNTFTKEVVYILDTNGN
jgi:hypothetical protein